CGLSEDDEIIALGDIVDRGPDTPRLCEFFAAHRNVRSIMGNHERKHIHSYQGKVRPALSQLITRRHFSESGYRKMIDLISEFPVYIELDNALLIHGLYEPETELKDQKENVLVGTMSGETYFLEKYHEPWYRLYDGDKPVIAGHHDYSRSHKPMVIDDKVFLIDTGCCYGGALTGLILPDFQIVSVVCKHDYWSRIKKQYADIRLTAKSDEKLTWEQAEDLIEGSVKQKNVPLDTVRRAEDLKSRLYAGEECLDKLYRKILETNDQILIGLRKDSKYDRMTPILQGRMYSRKIDNKSLEPLLHLARKGELTQEKLKKRFNTPGELMEFYGKLFK
ncbi:MAG: metallophosphoesterase, partial [Candidatus Aminicenantes bacterium]|nr:metallophosphoesterase [Candidatus Aminicenantes bacterium]